MCKRKQIQISCIPAQSTQLTKHCATAVRGLPTVISDLYTFSVIPEPSILSDTRAKQLETTIVIQKSCILKFRNKSLNVTNDQSLMTPHLNTFWAC